MKAKNTIIFDLDGTLIDSAPGITNSVQYALAQYDIHVPPEDLISFIGPPLLDSFMGYYHLSEQQAREAITHYRAHYNQHGVHKNSLYPGIQKIITTLYHQGKTLLIATTKPRLTAIEVLKSYQLDSYFSFISGSEMDGSRTDKTELIEYALEHIEISKIEHTVMVGDTKFDMIGAKNLDMDSIGVLYGFGTREELEREHATEIAETTADLATLLGL